VDHATPQVAVLELERDDLTAAQPGVAAEQHHQQAAQVRRRAAARSRS
jgi:hypothetical protein